VSPWPQANVPAAPEWLPQYRLLTNLVIFDIRANIEYRLCGLIINALDTTGVVSGAGQKLAYEFPLCASMVKAL
jgi:hypothetical protein